MIKKQKNHKIQENTGYKLIRYLPYEGYFFFSAGKW